MISAFLLKIFLNFRHKRVDEPLLEQQNCHQSDHWKQNNDQFEFHQQFEHLKLLNEWQILCFAIHIQYSKYKSRRAQIDIQLQADQQAQNRKEPEIFVKRRSERLPFTKSQSRRNVLETGNEKQRLFNFKNN